MRSARYVLGTCTLVMIAIGIYLKISHTAVSGADLYRGGWYGYTDTANSVFYYALCLAVVWIVVLRVQRKQNKDR